jgi:hypothetical protein
VADHPILCALFIFQDGQVGNNEYGDNRKINQNNSNEQYNSNLPI